MFDYTVLQQDISYESPKGQLKTFLFRINWPLRIVAVVVSIGWVTPGAATEGVTPLFFT